MQVGGTLKVRPKSEGGGFLRPPPPTSGQLFRMLPLLLPAGNRPHQKQRSRHQHLGGLMAVALDKPPPGHLGWRARVERQPVTGPAPHSLAAPSVPSRASSSVSGLAIPQARPNISNRPPTSKSAGCTSTSL